MVYFHISWLYLFYPPIFRGQILVLHTIALWITPGDYWGKVVYWKRRPALKSVKSAQAKIPGTGRYTEIPAGNLLPGNNKALILK